MAANNIYSPVTFDSGEDDLNIYTQTKFEDDCLEAMLLEYLGGPSLGYASPCSSKNSIGPQHSYFQSAECLYPDQQGSQQKYQQQLPAQEMQIRIELNSFTDLQKTLNDIVPNTVPEKRSLSLYSCQQHELAISHISRKECAFDETKKRSAEDELVLKSTDLSIPSSVRLNVESSLMLDSLMDLAVTHWCCIGFKVAPISLDLIKNWRRAPLSIVYCVASISLVTFMNQQAGEAFVKQAAMVFYDQAKHKMDDVFMDDMEPLTIQAYFCLSYTSNLLRQYDQQRTWGGLASIALHQRTRDMVAGRPMDELTLLCWFRWYYVDAWMCLTLNRPCLLPDDLPTISGSQAKTIYADKQYYELYQFARLTRYMRKYIRAMQSGKMFVSNVVGAKPGRIVPSSLYQSITSELKAWYDSQQNHLPSDSQVAGPQPLEANLHLHLCYNAVRLLVLFQFLHPVYSPPADILVDCLQTNLALLQALKYLKDIGCDQSTYHHMFFAIHNAARQIYMYDNDEADLKQFAHDQLCMNLMLLRGTQAYANDVFKVRLYAEKIEQEFRDLNITFDGWMNAGCSGKNNMINAYGPTFSSSTRGGPHCTRNTSTSAALAPQVFVFRQHPLKLSSSHQRTSSNSSGSKRSRTTSCNH